MTSPSVDTTIYYTTEYLQSPLLQDRRGAIVSVNSLGAISPGWPEAPPIYPDKIRLRDLRSTGVQTQDIHIPMVLHI